jgi:hypothetical protein
MLVLFVSCVQKCGYNMCTKDKVAWLCCRLVEAPM